MKTSKIIAASALATVMSASAAYADLSISGGMGGHFQTGDTISSSSRSWNTESVNVSYSDTLDNGMGISVTANVGQTAQSNGGDTNGTNYTMTISSDLGSLSWGDQLAPAADKADGLSGLSFYECCTWGSSAPDGMSIGYNDGDLGGENNGFLYQSPSINGWTIYASHLMTAGDATRTDDTNSLSVKGSIGPLSVAAGGTSFSGTPAVAAVDAVTADATSNPIVVGSAAVAAVPAVGSYESTFGIAAMSLGSVGVSLGMFNGGSTNTDSNAVTVDFPIGGLSAKVAYVDSNASGSAYDESGYHIGVKKGMGPATFGVQYSNADIASGSAGEVETWKLFYILYF